MKVSPKTWITRRYRHHLPGPSVYQGDWMIPGSHTRMSQHPCLLPTFNASPCSPASITSPVFPTSLFSHSDDSSIATGRPSPMATTATPTAASATPAVQLPLGQADLADCIEWQSVECLNENGNHTFVNALKQGYREDNGLHLESDADEQLLLYVPFNQVVKLHSIIIRGPPEDGPRTLKLFANRPNMGFSNVSDFPANDTVVASLENLEGKPIPLKYVKFQNVRSLTLFVEDNQGGGEVTQLQKLAIIGSTVETTNMKDLKKISENEG